MNQIKKDLQQNHDGYHTFGELYDHRHALVLMMVNHAWFRSLFCKSKHHNDGSMYEGWFIIQGDVPIERKMVASGHETIFKQISYHLPIQLWEDAHCQEVDVLAPWDGHTSFDVIDRLMKAAKLGQI